jgi:hypothetical protein
VATPATRTAGSVEILQNDRERFARLKRYRRVWAVAAIHGEATRLARLHDLVGARWQAGDRLVYLGNYLGRGAEIHAAIDEVLAFRRAIIGQPEGFACDVALLRGSQEEMWQKLMQLQFATNPREVLQWMLDQGVGATLAAYGADPQQGLVACREGPRGITRWTSAIRAAVNAAPGHTQLLTALRRAAFTEDGALLFVHAGIDASRPLDAQKDAFWWGGAGLLEMDQPFAGFRRVVRGFERNHLGLVEAPFAVSLDSGCGFGGELLAAAFTPDGAVVELVRA